MSQESSGLEQVYEQVRQEFESTRRIMSFSEYFDAFLEAPERFARNSVQYLRDCLLHYGEASIDGVTGQERHFRVFDAPFEDGREPMVGQRRAQNRVFGLLDNFVRSGRIDKLILLHGPNGSAKSTFVKTLMRGLEAYSETDAGALYRFNWIFPSETLTRAASIGFADSGRVIDQDSLETFAFLEDDVINTKLTDELYDHPLLLLPREIRNDFLGQALGDSDFVVSEYLERGDLSHTNRQIFDALLTAYRGDLKKVLKHVQVERFFFSRRYRSSLVRIEPQMRVDAALRQLTMDRSLSALPPSLQNITLHVPFGDLVDANRGVIEYDDLFKRHPDLNKYLLSISERGAVSLDDRILFVDLILLATGNETYLDAYKQTPDYASFKGRVELVRLPYLLDYRDEETIYAEQLSGLDVGKFVAPHTARVAALWSVLTRLKRPDPDNYPSELRDILSRLTPIEKADLYATGEVPADLAPEQARDLRSEIGAMFDEGAQGARYEGRYGASPREMKMILLNASQRPEYPCLSPLAVFDQLAELVKEQNVFPFLSMEADGEFHRHERFIETVRARYLDMLDMEVQLAMGLVDEKQYEDLFTRYIEHVRQWLAGEQVYNTTTAVYEDPDEKFLQNFEEMMGVEEEDEREFRNGLISTIAASFIDNPGQKLEYPRIFPTLFAGVRRSVFEERSKTIRKIQEHMLQYFEGEQDQLSSQELEAVEKTLQSLKGDYGHSEASAREAVAFLLSNRYKE